MSYFYLQFEKPLKPLDDIIQALESKGQNISKKEIQSLVVKKARKEKNSYGKYFF